MWLWHPNGSWQGLGMCLVFIIIGLVFYCMGTLVVPNSLVPPTYVFMALLHCISLKPPHCCVLNGCASCSVCHGSLVLLMWVWLTVYESSLLGYCYWFVGVGLVVLLLIGCWWLRWVRNLLQ